MNSDLLLIRRVLKSSTIGKHTQHEINIRFYDIIGSNRTTNTNSKFPEAQYFQYNIQKAAEIRQSPEGGV